MGKKRAGERDTEEQAQAAAAGTPDAKKSRSVIPVTDGASSGPGVAAVLCDDVVGNILARVPARTAVASMALSRRHRRLIRSAEFRSLHRRLAPPLPRPHIAYLVTATVRRRRALDKPNDPEVPASVFQGFHVAGAGFNGNVVAAPMRALTGRRYLGMEYVNTCNGVVLLAAGAGDKQFSARCRCILWNPAVADVVEEVPVPVPVPDAVASTDVGKIKDYRVLGLGYGQRSKTYKLILMCRRRNPRGCGSVAGRMDGSEKYSLVVTYTFAEDPGKQPKEIELPAVRDCEAISQHSLYMDGKIYLLEHSITNPAAILAFDVDNGTVSSINLPIECDCTNRYTSGLMELSGRPCVVAGDARACALWLLSADHRWERRCFIGDLCYSEGHIYPDSVMGVWDCGGVLVLYYREYMDNLDKLFLYDITAGKMFRANLGSVVTPECLETSDSDYALCWGYKPTLEAPSSIVGKLRQDQDVGRECTTYIMKALKPVAEQDRRRGQEATLNTVCFMDFLVRIMQKLPKDMQQVLEMRMMDSDDPDFTFENVLFRENIQLVLIHHASLLI